MALYELKNDENGEVFMGIIEAKANKLLNESSFVTDSGEASPLSLRTVEQLARVQALFIYQFIRLPNGHKLKR